MNATRRCGACRTQHPAEQFRNPQARRCLRCDAAAAQRAALRPRQCRQCRHTKPRRDFNGRQAVCRACWEARPAPTRACARCRQQAPVGEYGAHGKLCATCKATPRTPVRKDTACLVCHEVKPRSAFPGLGRKTCTECRQRKDAARTTRACRRCREQHPVEVYGPGVGGAMCPTCRATPTAPPPSHARACFACLQTKPAEAFPFGPGRNRAKTGPGKYRRRSAVCAECQAERAQRKAAKRQARITTWELDGAMVRRCGHCQEVKPLEEGYYVSRRKASGEAVRDHRCKECQKQRIAEIKRAMKATPEGRAKQAEWQAAWRKRHPERAAELQRQHRLRVAADPERRARANESTRMGHRLRRERRDGVPVTELRHPQRKGIYDTDRERVPSLPLVREIERAIDLQSKGDPGGMGENQNDRATEAVCARVGVADRILARYRNGAWPTVGLSKADGILVELGLLWWEVWNEQTVRKPVLEVTHWVLRERSPKGKRTYVSRERTRATRYGDAGPDLAALERVRHAFEGCAQEPCPHCQPEAEQQHELVAA